MCALRPRGWPGADHNAAYSPPSNGLAEAFVKTFKRDYGDGAELHDAETVLAYWGPGSTTTTRARRTRRSACGARPMELSSSVTGGRAPATPTKGDPQAQPFIAILLPTPLPGLT